MDTICEFIEEVKKLSYVQRREWWGDWFTYPGRPENEVQVVKLYFIETVHELLPGNSLGQLTSSRTVPVHEPGAEYLSYELKDSSLLILGRYYVSK
jgi:hypothetical protein